MNLNWVQKNWLVFWIQFEFKTYCFELNSSSKIMFLNSIRVQKIVFWTQFEFKTYVFELDSSSQNSFFELNSSSKNSFLNSTWTKQEHKTRTSFGVVCNSIEYNTEEDIDRLRLLLSQKYVNLRKQCAILFFCRVATNRWIRSNKLALVYLGLPLRMLYQNRSFSIKAISFYTYI